MNQQYKAQLQKLLGTTTSTQLGGALNDEIGALDGKGGGGSSAIEQGTGSMGDLTGTSASVNADRSDMALVDNGKAVWTQVVDPKTGTTQWQPVFNPPPGQAPPTTEGFTVLATVNGQTVPIFITTHGLLSQAMAPGDPRTGVPGAPLDSATGDNVIGRYYVDPSGVTHYGIFDEQGKLEYYDHPPFADNLNPRTTVDANGNMTVSVVPADGG